MNRIRHWCWRGFLNRNQWLLRGSLIVGGAAASTVLMFPVYYGTGFILDKSGIVETSLQTGERMSGRMNEKSAAGILALTDGLAAVGFGGLSLSLLRDKTCLTNRCAYSMTRGTGAVNLIVCLVMLGFTISQVDDFLYHRKQERK